MMVGDRQHISDDLMHTERTDLGIHHAQHDLAHADPDTLGHRSQIMPPMVKKQQPSKGRVFPHTFVKEASLA
jgi:hypothetical protein